MPNKLTKEQIEALAQNLSFPYHFVKLVCDGYTVDLGVSAKTKTGMSFHVVMRINGTIKGAWLGSKNTHPEQRFLNKRTRQLFNKAAIERFEKSLGKRRAKQFMIEHQETIVSYCFTWPSGKAALNHLNRVCESIEIVESI